MSQQASSSRLEKMAALKENADTKDYSILVTGATGFIGKKLLERLAKTGYKVTAMSRSKYPDAENIKFVAADAFEMNSLTKALKGIETAFYLLHSMEGSKKNGRNLQIEKNYRLRIFLKLQKMQE